MKAGDKIVVSKDTGYVVNNSLFAKYGMILGATDTGANIRFDSGVFYLESTEFTVLDEPKIKHLTHNETHAIIYTHDNIPSITYFTDANDLNRWMANYQLEHQGDDDYAICNVVKGEILFTEATIREADNYEV